MTLKGHGQGHGGNYLGRVGARHLYPNFDDTRLLICGIRNGNEVTNLTDHICTQDYIAWMT